MAEPQSDAYDYVVVGSGAGGGTVAARLAESGMRVLVLEAGADPSVGRADGLQDDYDVPAFHPFASEHPAMAWNYRVHDFGGDASRRPGADASGRRGVLYPRASTLGGCTAHNAMILMAPPDSDWNAIAELTGDPSWRAENMRRYFQRLENCRYRPLARLIARLTGGRVNPSGHGYDGWLDVEVPTPIEAFGDRALIKTILAAIAADLDLFVPSTLRRIGDALERLIERKTRFLVGEDDPNDQRLQGRLAEGLTLAPLSTFKGRRRGARERVLAAIEAHGLRIEFDALATQVIFDERLRAIGVEYLKGRNLYRATQAPAEAPGQSHKAMARREVILAAGAFNTPQILMLSGVGPLDELTKHAIKARVSLEGVGSNLQDRYEVGVVHKTREPWACLSGVRFSADDAVYDEWRRGRGMYQSNGAAVAFSLRSKRAREEGSAADLFVMALVTRFFGYFTGYSDIIRKSRADLTFAVLKAHTRNRGGRVRLFSTDPREPPEIDFHGFEEGTDRRGQDLDAVVEGVRRLRKMAAQASEWLDPEDTPGTDYDDADRLKDFVRRHAWGHHASCTCAIGKRQDGGVLTSDFRVHGTERLRVVDASVFPRIPGFFIVSAIYMIAEKAADVILEAASAKA